MLNFSSNNMERTYESFDDIKKDLKRLNLQRQIAYEELKGLKYDVQEDFSSNNWVQTAFGAVKKFGILYLIRKILR